MQKRLAGLGEIVVTEAGQFRADDSGKPMRVGLLLQDGAERGAVPVLVAAFLQARQHVGGAGRDGERLPLIAALGADVVDSE
jgi:hypothetical protein